MNAWPEGTTVEHFLVRVRRRMVVLRAMEGVAAGCALASLFILAGMRPDRVPAVAALVATVIVVAIVRVVFGDEWRIGWWRSLPEIAGRLERRTTLGRNLIVTAAELSHVGRQYVRDVVMARAAGIVSGLDPTPLFPARAAGIVLTIGVIMLAVSLLRPAETAGTMTRTLVHTGGPAVRSVEVRITPPAYSGMPVTTAINPSRIEALAASRIDVRVEATASSVNLETLSGTRAMERRDGSFTAALTAESDGFLAMEPRDSTGAVGARQLVGVGVTTDRPPRVNLTSPGRDLFFSSVPDTIPVVITADDDLALGSVRLRYTAVSGSGERFTFTERDVPVAVTAASPRSWTARGTWRLEELGLAPGDLVVYRAAATDRRPGAAPVESESYVLEVVTPGAIAAEGFAADDQRDRYAVSQQMVILKTERLLARRPSMAADSVSVEARQLAAEQRQVRAEFVFMMGGEVEDLAAEAAGTLELNEAAEAEAESDLLAGRLQNRGRVDMMRAIRAMSRASSSLTDANLDQALQAERSALENLMRAFARSRFILRALTQRERIDLERRLSGTLSLTAGLSGPAATPVPDDRTAALRRLLADLAAMSSGDSVAQRSYRVTNSALDLLRTDPGSDSLRALALRIQEVAGQARTGPVPDVRMRIDSLVKQVLGLVAGSLSAAPGSRTFLETGLLEGALRDALKREGRRP